jgi:IclR family transcriptional regulator, acetate operon repressor
MTDKMPTMSSTRAVDRAVELLAQVCERGEIGLADCAREVGLPTSTALRLLRSLEVSGLISRNAAGLFSAGPRLLQLGAQALSRQSLVGMAAPALARLVAACGETAYLAIPGPDGSAVYAGMVEGRHSIRHTGWVGRSIPLEGSAVGAVFRDRASLAGWVQASSAVEPDVTAIAAPIRRPSPGGTVVTAALSVVGPVYRIDPGAAARIGNLVRSEAELLSIALGVPAPVLGVVADRRTG